MTQSRTSEVPVYDLEHPEGLHHWSQSAATLLPPSAQYSMTQDANLCVESVQQETQQLLSICSSKEP